MEATLSNYGEWQEYWRRRLYQHFSQDHPGHRPILLQNRLSKILKSLQRISLEFYANGRSKVILFYS
ncbi:hypothetical protein SUGI_1176660 [Cryptomeria japonica]|nr:hypothetical protein SUGI_1176660 [Cryptomeria japonica]